ncbi:MAG: EAL domain-containing protein [Azoarcus sp.]|jgi:diguanylate cyclase (GGDEF)-like protein/PAS domain S-box-containing protein|nr:EAL domain-containing protein [Azoarcus sp.]
MLFPLAASNTSVTSSFCHSVFHDSTIPFLVTTLEEGLFVDVNAAFEAAFGWKREDLHGKTTTEVGLWDDRESRDMFLEQVKQKDGMLPVTLTMAYRDGVLHHYRSFAMRLNHEGAPYFFTVFIDIQDQINAEKKAQDSHSRLSQLYDAMIDGYARVDKNLHIQECNRAFREMLGYTEEEIQSLTPRYITPPGWRPLDVLIEQEQLLRRGYSDIYEKELQRKDGSTFPIELQLYRCLDGNGNYDGFWGVVRDISERKRQQANIDYLSYHDVLTKLPNRALLLENLEHTLKRAKHLFPNAIAQKMPLEDSYQIALLFIDLDHFKNINDTMGHAVGDALLQIAADKMSHVLRESDLLARIGGDEFVILLDAPITTVAATGIASRVLSLFSSPVSLQEKEVYISASIGISLFPKDGDDTESLIKYAELAMFQAKSEGRAAFRFYGAELGAGIMERMTLEHALRGALQRCEFVLYYQPQIALASGQLAGVEALLRWMHPERGLVLPGQFISIAEDIGIISDIGAWVLQEACRQMVEWRAEGFDVPSLAVNISAQQFARSDLVAIVQTQLEKHRLPPHMLELEVTESLLMHKTEWILATLEGVKKMGVRLSIDDFGTGYSSLGYLKNLPVQRLKIDNSFVRDICLDNSGEAITRAVIALSTSLGLETVAEGVEREEQEKFLRDEGCQIVQGFRYAHPMTSAEIQALYGKRQGAAKPPV